MTEIENQTTEEKAVSTAEVVNTWVPHGVYSFSDLDAAKEAEAMAQMTMSTADQFMDLARNILHSDEIENKAAAITALAGEFSGRIESVSSKEITDKAVWSTAKVNDLPDSSFLHILPGGKKDSDGKIAPRNLRMFPYKDASGKVDLPHLRNAIARIPQSNRIDAATKKRLQTRARKILADQQKEKTGIVDWVKEKLGLDPLPEPEPFTVWKEQDGQMHWMAVYSNNYRDDDATPEIISKQAHLDFVQAVDKGDWPMPELWHWHVKGSRYGVATVVTYDDETGMSLAAGVIDSDKEHIASAIAERGNYLVSHGMPTKEIQRDNDDPTVITRYRSREISTLPSEAAANKLTYFITKEEQKDMTIPEKKKEELESVGFDVEQIEAQLEAGKAKAESEKRESKEIEAPAETETVEMPVETPAAPSQPEPLTNESIATAFAEAIKPLVERVEAVEGQIKELSQPEPETEKELDLTPAASLASMLRSAVIGQDATRVDGRSARHDAPKETTDKAKSALNSGNLLADTVVNQLLEGSWMEDLPIRKQ